MPKVNLHESWEIFEACFKTLVLAFEYLRLIISNNTLIGLFLNIYRAQKIGKTKYELHKKVTRAGRRKLTDAKKNISIPELAYYLKLEASKTN